MKNKIRNFILRFLFLENIQRVNEELRATNVCLKRDIEYLQNALQDQSNRLGHQSILLNNTRKLIKVGVDVHDPRYGKSWAVVCIAGKTDFVQFYDLPAHTVLDLKRMLEQFKGCNTTIDKPPHLRNMF